MTYNLNGLNTLVSFRDNPWNTIFYSHWVKLSTHVHLAGQCGHAAMLVLGKVKILGIGNLQTCFQSLMNLSITQLGRAIFVHYTLWAMVARSLPKQSASNARPLHVPVTELCAQWGHWPSTYSPGTTCRIRIIHLMLQREKNHGKGF